MEKTINCIWEFKQTADTSKLKLVLLQTEAKISAEQYEDLFIVYTNAFFWANRCSRIVNPIHFMNANIFWKIASLLELDYTEVYFFKKEFCS